MIGRLLTILLPVGSGSAQGLLVLEEFHVGEALHFQFGMPILIPTTNISGALVVVPSNVCFLRCSFLPHAHFLLVDNSVHV